MCNDKRGKPVVTNVKRRKFSNIINSEVLFSNNRDKLILDNGLRAKFSKNSEDKNLTPNVRKNNSVLVWAYNFDNIS